MGRSPRVKIVRVVRDRVDMIIQAVSGRTLRVRPQIVTV
jgi:hypothetical protein